MGEKIPEFLEPVADFIEVAKQSIQEGDTIESTLQRYVAVRDKKELTKLYERFSEAFGPEGEMIAAHPSKAVYFNGGKDPAEPDKYFPGLHFSLPLMAYVMRRALDEDDKEESFKKYIKNVKTLVRERNEDVDKHNNAIIDDFYGDSEEFDHDFHVLLYKQHAHEGEEDALPKFLESLNINAYPTPNMIEKLCAPTLRALDNLSQKRALEAEQNLSEAQGSADGNDFEEPEL